MKRIARVAIVAATLAATTALSGCAALISPQQTANYRYNGGDGASADVGGVAIRGLMIVGTEADAPGRLFYAAINETNAAKTLTLEYEGEEFTQDLEPREQFYVSDTEESEPIVIPEVGADAGALVDFAVEVDGESVDVEAQVIGPDHPDYADLVPTTEPAAEPSETTTPGAEEEGDAATEEGAGDEGETATEEGTGESAEEPTETAAP